MSLADQNMCGSAHGIGDLLRFGLREDDQVHSCCFAKKGSGTYADKNYSRHCLFRQRPFESGSYLCPKQRLCWV